MAGRYHISDSGIPAICRAKTPERCPKTRAGDSLHGTAEEAQAESERRFESTYGANTTVGSKTEKKAWNRIAKNLHDEGVALHRNNPVGSSDISARVFELKREGLGKIHGVGPERVSSDGMNFIVKEPNGPMRVYGPSFHSDLQYNGILHPNLSSVVYRGSESKLMVGDQEATWEQIRAGRVKSYGYATVRTADGAEVTFTTDSNGYPVRDRVWGDDIGENVPDSFFEDEKLRSAIAQGGTLSDL